MKTRLKEHLIKIADQLTADSTLEDVYQHLALLADIDTSEKQYESGEILTQSEVEAKAKKWLK
jgi:hypothetical protein